MKNKINLIHQQRKSKKKILILSLIGIALSTSILIFYISSNIWPVLMHYAKVDAKYIVTEIMNQAVKNKIPSQLQKQELFKTSKDERGIITMIDFNPVVINQLLTFTNQLVRDNLKALENGDVVFLKKSDIILDNALFKKIKKGLVSKIPMGTVTNNVLLSNLGPKIPVKIHFIGNVTSSVSSKVTSYGINNAMMEAFVKVNINVQIALPLSLEEISVMTEIPIAMKMIQGQVPNYYQKGYDRDSLLLSTPIIK